MTIAGFGAITDGAPQFVLDGAPMPDNVVESITDGIVEVTIAGPSTVTLQMTDPHRTLLNSGLFNFGSTLEFDGLSFSLIELQKASDQLEAVYESSVIYSLTQQIGETAAYTDTDVGAFVQFLVNQVPNNGTVIDPTPALTPQVIQRGSDEDDLEDSWTAIQRLATTIGWRAFEYLGIVYFVSDPYLLGQPNLGTIQEFTIPVQNIDFDWDTLKPFGDMTVTGMTELWTYPPGSPINVINVGPPSGQWLVSDCQRDMYNPQCSITLTIPLTPQQSIDQQTEANG